MAGKRTRKPIALSHGVKDAPTSKAIRQLEGVARDLQGAVSDLQNAPATGGVQSVTAGSSKVTASPTTGAVVVDVVPANFPAFSASAQGVVPASGGGSSKWLRSDGWAAARLDGLFSLVISAVPTQASTGLTTWLNQPTGATVTDGTQGMVIHCPGGGSARVFAAVGKTAPTAPYTITVLLGVSAYLEQGETSTAATTTMFGWSDGTKTHAIWVTPTNNAAVMGDLTLLIVGDTTFNNGSLTIQKTFGGSISPRMWLRLKDDGTSVSIYASGDGENFVGLYTVSKAAGYLAGNYTKIVLGQDAPIREGYVQVLSYTEA